MLRKNMMVINLLFWGTIIWPSTHLLKEALSNKFCQNSVLEKNQTFIVVLQTTVPPEF